MEARYGKEGIRQFLYTLRKGILGGSTRGALQAGLPHHPRGVRRRLRQVAEGALQALPRQAAAGRLRPRPLAGPGEDELHPGLRLRPEPLGGDRGGHHREPLRRRGGRGARLDQGRGGHPEPHRRLRHRLGELRHQQRVRGRPLGRLRPPGRPRRLLRPHRQGAELLPGLRARRQGAEAGPGRRSTRPRPRASSPTAGRSSSPRSRRASPTSGRLDLETGAVTNLTRDEYADNNPQVSPDGKLVVYERRISGNAKVYAFPLGDPSRKTQLTFGPFDDTAPAFSTDGKKVYYSSDEDDDIPNLRSLDLQTGAIAQYTDVFGGTMAPAPLKTPRGDRLAFITYYKGEYLLHTKDTAEPVKEVEQEVQSAAEGLVDFQPDVTHQVVPENKRRKRLFEGLYLEGRPPINVGVTSSGNFYGGTAIALTDVLGDQHFSATVLSVSSYRIYDGRYTNLASRLHSGFNFFDQTYFFYPYYAAVRPVLRLRHPRPRDRHPALHRGPGLRRVPPRHLPPARGRAGDHQGRRAVRGRRASRSWSASRTPSRACPASSTTAGRPPSRCGSSRRRPGSPSSARSPAAPSAWG